MILNESLDTKTVIHSRQVWIKTKKKDKEHLYNTWVSIGKKKRKHDRINQMHWIQLQANQWHYPFYKQLCAITKFSNKLISQHTWIIVQFLEQKIVLFFWIILQDINYYLRLFSHVDVSLTILEWKKKQFKSFEQYF